MRLVIALLAALCACAAPQTVHAPARRPSPAAALRVAADEDLGPWLPYVRQGVRMLRRAGADVALARAGDVANLRLRHADYANPDTAPVDPRDPWAGIYVRAERAVYVQPSMIAGGPQWAATIAHEFSHAMGALHVCGDTRMLRDEQGNPCSPVGRGVALMNHHLPSPAWACDPFTEACADDDGELFTALSDLDRRELRRVGAIPAP